MEQVAVARSQVVAAVPGVLGVKLVVLPAVTSASVIVPVKAWQAPVPSGPAGTLMSDWAEATAEFKIGRASCRERVCQHVEISVVADALKKKTQIRTVVPEISDN